MLGTARSSRRRPALAAIIVTTALAAVVAVPPPGAGAEGNHHASVAPKALAFHDAMRALWQSHGTWTERAIVDFVGGLPDT